jgi:hypothetical protein
MINRINRARRDRSGTKKKRFKGSARRILTECFNEHIGEYDNTGCPEYHYAFD